MKYYLYKLWPPRATFLQDMTEAELKIMQSHSAYWAGQMREGKAVAFGPVADPSGTYGVGIIELDDTTDPQSLTGQDPAVLANAGFRTEIFSMPRLMARKA